MATTQSTTELMDRPASEQWGGVIAFQRDILLVLLEIESDDETSYGLEIKRRLEDFYGVEVNHGRLYPNLDDLVEQGYIRKSELDKRTNEYRLTESARELLNKQSDRFVEATR